MGAAGNKPACAFANYAHHALVWPTIGRRTFHGPYLDKDEDGYGHAWRAR